MTNRLSSFVLLTSLIVFARVDPSRAALSTPVTYPGNGGAGGTVANGSLTLQDNGTTVFGTFNKAMGMSFQLDLVLYIDSTAGGFTDNKSFRDNGDAMRTAISGFNKAANRGSTATFAPGVCSGLRDHFGRQSAEQRKRLVPFSRRGRWELYANNKREPQSEQ